MSTRLQRSSPGTGRRGTARPPAGVRTPRASTAVLATLGPDADPSLVLLAASTWLVVLWLRSIDRPLEEGDAP